jgi:DNA-binding CsgD family transcriptional regulator
MSVAIPEIFPARRALRERLLDVLAATAELVGHATADAPASVDEGLSLLQLARELVVQRLEDEIGGSAELVACLARQLLDIDAVLQELDARVRSERSDTMSEVHDALSRLRGVDSPAALLDEAIDELHRFARFDRVVVLHVARDGQLSIGHERPTLRSESPPYLPGAIDREVIRRRVALLVPATMQPAEGLARRFAGASFVAAPVVAEGAVVAILAATRHPRRAALGQLDRDAAWTFAVGLGYALERTILVERLGAQRASVRRLASAAESIADGLADTRLRVAETDISAPGFADAEAAPRAPRVSSRGSELSARECDVLDAMSRGATNAEIAAGLFISEETVKSHVKRILRKLRASNRAQAVSCYLTQVR